MDIGRIRSKYLNFYTSREHRAIPSASLVPENDPSTLFTGSGMQPLIPYLLGSKHPDGIRLVNSQKSFRSVDIDDVGDNRHTTFFEMLGNWSLGDYFKKEQLPWIFSFLTEEIKLDPKKIYVTAFIGDKENNIPRDDESASIWKRLFAEKSIDANDIEIGPEANGYNVGMQGGRIFYYDVKKNWWSRSGVPSNMPAGEPGGPDSEMFYEFSDIEHDKKFGEYCHPNCDCGRYIEIGNSVFMEYIKQADGTFAKLPQRNVDFGGGLERIAMVSENTPDIFLISAFKPLITRLEELSAKKYSDSKYTASFRVVADHIRSAIFLIGDGVVPSNSERGYFVRRLIRRAVRYIDNLEIKDFHISDVVGTVLEPYKDAYPDTYKKITEISEIIKNEEQKFRKTVHAGIKELEALLAKNKTINGVDAFNLYQSFGLPLELTREIAKQIKGADVSIDDKAFFTEHTRHRDLSRAGSDKKFKGGLADTSEQTIRYHTATHLLNAALRSVLGGHVVQKGSNITAERLRFDFPHNSKMTDDEKAKVEQFVNDAISRELPVVREEMSKDDALKLGAVHAFNEKYGDTVSVYSVGDTKTGYLSREFCGGPHVQNTKELAGPDGKWHFKIQKEEAVAAGVRRIKAVLE